MIRPIQDSDMIELNALIRESLLFNAQYGHWEPDEVLSELATADSLAYVQEDRIMGFILYRNLPDVVEISFMLTGVNHRGKAVAKKLITFLHLNVARGREVWLEVSSNNIPAQSLYISCGYQKVGERKSYYRDGTTAFLFSHKNLHS